MEDQQLSRVSRLPLWLAAAGSLLWLIFLGWLVANNAPPPAGNAELAAILGQWVAPALAPVAALFAIAAAMLLSHRPAGAWPPVPAEDPLDGAEADLTGTIARVATVRQLLADDLLALTGAAGTLQKQGAAVTTHATAMRQETETAMAAGADLADRLASLNAEASDILMKLASASDGISDRTEGMKAIATALGDAFAKAAREGAQSASAVDQAVADLSARMAAAQAATSALVNDLQNHAVRSFDSNAQAMAALEKSVTAQSAAMAASLHDARAALDRIGGETQERMAGVLAELTADAEALEERLLAQVAATESLSLSAERSFKLLDSRLDLSMRTSGDALDKLGQRLADVNAETDRVALPLREGKTAVAALDMAVSGLRETVMQTIDVMGQTLPERTVAASRAAETLTSDLTALVAAIDAAHGRASDIAVPIGESRAVIDAATGAFAAQRDAMQVAGEALVVELEQARQLISEVEDQTRDSSLTAATRLVDAMSRVKEVAGQAAGTMRETLDGVIAEAKDSLSDAAQEAMQRSFVQPIAEQARQAEAAAEAASTTARAASERAASSLLALATTMKQIEDRALRTQESLEEAVQRDLSASTQLLTDRMASLAVSMVAAMGKPMTDAELKEWRSGERSMFGKRAVALLDRAGKRALKDKIAADPDFADLARSHVAAFDALVVRLGPDTPLARLLSQSDGGRIAMILTEAMED